MSRIGRKPISVPSGVEVKIDGSTVSVKGPKGQLQHVVAEPITVHRNEDGVLEVVRSSVSLDHIGGLENLKTWLRKRNGAWLDEAAAYGLPAPKGVLITGVPGCGKSMTAKAMSSAWSLPLVRLDIGRVFGGRARRRERGGDREIDLVLPGPVAHHQQVVGTPGARHR